MKVRQKNRGQSIVEYILVTGFVALAAIALFKSFRSSLAEAYEKAGNAIVQGVDEGLKASPESQ